MADAVREQNTGQKKMNKVTEAWKKKAEEMIM